MIQTSFNLDRIVPAFNRPVTITFCRSNPSHQLARGRAKRSHLLLDFSVLPNNQQTSHDGGLMHIQSTTTFDQGLHNTSLAEAIAAPRVCYRHCYASFPISGCDKKWYLYRRGSVLPTGSTSTQRYPTSKQSPSSVACITD